MEIGKRLNAPKPQRGGNEANALGEGAVIHGVDERRKMGKFSGEKNHTVLKNGSLASKPGPLKPFKSAWLSKGMGQR